MLPNLADPRWKKIVTNPEVYKSQVKALSTRMMLGALKIKGQREPVDKLIQHAYNFFKKNEKTVANDIKVLFQ